MAAPGASGDVGDGLDVGEDLVERPGVEGDHPGVTAEMVEGVGDFTHIHRADRAQILGEDEIGVEIAQNVTVKMIKSMVHDIRARGEPAAANDKT